MGAPLVAFAILNTRYASTEILVYEADSPRFVASPL
jgi:hypothetical protein